MSKNAWAKFRGPNTCMLKVCLGWLKPNLKQTELQKLKNRGKKGWIRPENKKTENHERQLLATLKRLKRGDNNEFERNLRLEKVVSRKMLKLAGDRRRQKSKNDAATTRLRLAMETDEESKARLEKMVLPTAHVSHD